MATTPNKGVAVAASINDPALDAAVTKLKSSLRARRQATTLLRRPLTTLYVFARVAAGWIKAALNWLLARQVLCYALFLTTAITAGVIITPGPQQQFVLSASVLLWYVTYWVGLGVLSSIGLGTGLHTFLLFLGPWIKDVTITAARCGSLNFPTDGPNKFTCAAGATAGNVAFIDIFQKVAFTAFLWGAGTAIGELPPYFVSRAAAQSGQKLAELEEVEEDESKANGALTMMDKAKLTIFHALQKWGFWAIVACASIPNPLFDLAGITCGHFQIPFWTFFGATFIGKAFIKALGQAAFTIAVFGQAKLALVLLGWLNSLSFLPEFIRAALKKVVAGLETQFDSKEAPADGIAGQVWNIFIALMIGWFVKSIIESSVQEQMTVRDQATVEKYKAEFATKRALNAALGNGGATPIASPAATPAATPIRGRSPVQSPAISRDPSPAPAAAAAAPAAEPLVRRNSSRGAAAAAAAASSSSAAAAAPEVAEGTVDYSSLDAGVTPARASSRAGVKKQASTAKLTKPKKAEESDDDSSSSGAGRTPAASRLTRSASRTTRSSSSRKLL